MANCNLAPGDGFVCETDTKENLSPGNGFILETFAVAAPAEDTKLPDIIFFG